MLVRPGQAISLDPLVTITVIAAGGVVVGGTTASDPEEENDMSVALLVNLRGFKAFLGGDLHAHTERKFDQRDLVVSVDSPGGTLANDVSRSPVEPL